MEITHFKDVFRSLADDQDGILYWKEETLCRFLVIPDALGPGPVIHQMATYLGAFPFPSLAPSILTIEAMLKVVVVMTERYNRVLKRGNTDRNKLLFRSLAVFDRQMNPTYGKPGEDITNDASNDIKNPSKEDDVEIVRTHVAGFAVDQPANDDEEEEEDDDELAMAALDSLDAIEVFKHDHRADTKIHHAQIPVDNLRRLLMLLLVITPLGPQESLSIHAQSLTPDRIERLGRVADSILWSFAPEENAGIFYNAFNTIIPASLPYLFDGLNPLFEHFLYSKNIDLSRRKRASSTNPPTSPILRVREIIPKTLLPQESEILNADVLSQLSFFLKGDKLFQHLRLLYSGGDNGFSMGSLEHRVFHWRAPSILLVSGTRLHQTPKSGRERTFADTLPPKRFPDSSPGNRISGRVIFGAYLTTPWKHTNKEAIGDISTLLFQLSPIHEVFRASSLSKHYFTFSKSGIAFGNPPATKPISSLPSHTILGPISLLLDASLEYGVFNHEGAGGGSFYPGESRKQDWQDRFEIESLEVWGVGGDEEVEGQKAAWKFEDREAAARKNLRMGKDIEADRALLEMAGIIGQGRSGGSMAT